MNTQLLKKNDTRLKIMEVFYDLVLEKDFVRLTVSQICNAAGISRKTFYTYFKDKNEIVEQIIMKDSNEPLEKIIELYMNTDVPSEMIIEWQFQQFYKHRKFYKAINVFTGQNSFYEFIKKSAEDVISRKLKPLNLNEMEYEYMTFYYATSHAMLLVKWIEDGMPIPPKMIAQFYNKWNVPIFNEYSKRA